MSIKISSLNVFPPSANSNEYLLTKLWEQIGFYLIKKEDVFRPTCNYMDSVSLSLVKNQNKRLKRKLDGTDVKILVFVNVTFTQLWNNWNWTWNDRSLFKGNTFMKQAKGNAMNFCWLITIHFQCIWLFERVWSYIKTTSMFSFLILIIFRPDHVF